MRSGGFRGGIYSIIAYDPVSNAWGVAAAGRLLALGSLVPWVQAGAGAVVTQGWPNSDAGRMALGLLADGMSAAGVIERLSGGDRGRWYRQFAVIDRFGKVAAYTGQECYPWKGHIAGQHFSCQATGVAGRKILDDMAAVYVGSSGPLADRLVAALRAAASAMGERQSQQAAAIVVAREHAGYRGIGDREVDLRVDDHPRPCEELARLLDLQRLYYPQPGAIQKTQATPELIRPLQQALAQMGFYTGPVDGCLSASTRAALTAFCEAENLEARLFPDDMIDPVVVERASYLAGSRP